MAKTSQNQENRERVLAHLKLRINGLKQALHQGEKGLDQVIAALQDDSEPITRAAYMLLKHNPHPKVREALKQYNPYRFFKCIRTLGGHSSRVYSIAISPDSQMLASGTNDNIIKLWQIQRGLEEQILRDILTGWILWPLVPMARC